MMVITNAPYKALFSIFMMRRAQTARLGVSLPCRGRAGVGPNEAPKMPHNGLLLTSPLQGEKHLHGTAFTPISNGGTP